MSEDASKPIPKIKGLLPVDLVKPKGIKHPGQKGNPNLGHSSKERHQGINDHLEMAYHNDCDATMELQREKPKHRLMAVMAANGFSVVEIAEALSSTQPWVSQVLRQPWMRTQIQALQQGVADEFRAKLIEEGQEAYIRIVDMSKDSEVKDSVKADLNKYLVNRLLGQPTQPIEAYGKDVSTMSDTELQMALTQVMKEDAPKP